MSVDLFLGPNIFLRIYDYFNEMDLVPFILIRSFELKYNPKNAATLQLLIEFCCPKPYAQSSSPVASPSKLIPSKI